MIFLRLSDHLQINHVTFMVSYYHMEKSLICLEAVNCYMDNAATNWVGKKTQFHFHTLFAYFLFQTE